MTDHDLGIPFVEAYPDMANRDSPGLPRGPHPAIGPRGRAALRVATWQIDGHQVDIALVADANDGKLIMYHNINP